MKTYQQPHTDVLGMNAMLLLQGQSGNQVLNVFQTTITDANQILSKEASVGFELWEHSVWGDEE